MTKLKNKRHDHRVACTIRAFVVILILGLMSYCGVRYVRHRQAEAKKLAAEKARQMEEQARLERMQLQAEATSVLQNIKVKLSDLQRLSDDLGWDGELTKQLTAYQSSRDELNSFASVDLSEKEKEMNELLEVCNPNDVQKVVPDIKKAFSSIRAKKKSLTEYLEKNKETSEKLELFDALKVLGELKARQEQLLEVQASLEEKQKNDTLTKEVLADAAEKLATPLSVVQEVDDVRQRLARIVPMTSEQVSECKMAVHALEKAFQPLMELPKDKEIIFARNSKECNLQYANLTREVASLKKMPSDNLAQGNAEYNSLFEQTTEIYDSKILGVMEKILKELDSANNPQTNIEARIYILQQVKDEMNSVTGAIAEYREGQKRIVVLAAKLGQENKTPAQPANNPPQNIMPGNPAGGNPVAVPQGVVPPVVAPLVTAQPVAVPQVTPQPVVPVVNRYKVSIILSKGDRFKKQMTQVIEEMHKPNNDFSLEANEPELEDAGTRCSIDFYIRSYGNENHIADSVGTLLSPYKVKRDRIIVKPR